MKNVLSVLVLLFCSLLTTAYADRTQERVYLIQVLNQLDAMQPIILAAQKEQPKNIRIKFHYTKYRDSNGQWHNGLLDDVQAIRAGILQEINRTSVEPRTVMPIKGDYQ